MMNDAVNHPAHYTDGKYETIDFIEACDFDSSFCLGNAVKYISRAGKKDPERKKEDLQKAIWYLERYICEQHNHEKAEIDVFDYTKDKQLTPRLSEALVRLTMHRHMHDLKHDPDYDIQKVIDNLKKEIEE